MPCSLLNKNCERRYSHSFSGSASSGAMRFMGRSKKSLTWVLLTRPSNIKARPFTPASSNSSKMRSAEPRIPCSMRSRSSTMLLSSFSGIISPSTRRRSPADIGSFPAGESRRRARKRRGQADARCGFLRRKYHFPCRGNSFSLFAAAAGICVGICRPNP